MSAATTDLFGTPIIDSFSGEYGFLSNFYLEPVTIWNTTFRSAEHAYQWAKTLNPKEKFGILWNDPEATYPTTPYQAKKRGRASTLRQEWEHIKIGIMYEVVKAKFQQTPTLLQRLIDTGAAILIEGNTWHDNTFGNCVCEKCVSIPGLNVLGNVLMLIRTNECAFSMTQV
jgi:ribA/ribD-fused uncharacterized protein